MDIKHKIQFGCNADELAMKVLSGKKTATSSLYDYHYNEYKDIIKVGDVSLENWKRIHTEYYSSILKKIGLKLTGETRSLCEWFTVVVPKTQE